jgi:hypothetical protein
LWTNGFKLYFDGEDNKDYQSSNSDNKNSEFYQHRLLDKRSLFVCICSRGGIKCLGEVSTPYRLVTSVVKISTGMKNVTLHQSLSEENFILWSSWNQVSILLQFSFLFSVSGNSFFFVISLDIFLWGTLLLNSLI